MKNYYEAPELEIVCFTPCQNIAYIDFGDLKDAAANGNGSAAEAESASEGYSDVYMPRY